MSEKEELNEKELAAVAGGEETGMHTPNLDKIHFLIACKECGYEETVDVYTIIPKLRCPRCRATGTMKKIKTL